VVIRITQSIQNGTEKVNVQPALWRVSWKAASGDVGLMSQLRCRRVALWALCFPASTHEASRQIDYHPQFLLNDTATIGSHRSDLPTSDNR
jgi:hypothetical protein